jgi:catechol 2,3-dioxygenase-like lactoylglutathione lyase family enzyme
MIRGINHLNLAVRDLDESLRFYRDVLGCTLVVRWNKGVYLSAGDLWLALTLDPRTRSGPLPEYTHIAFDVSPQDFPLLSARILEAGTKLWNENTSEGPSLYFQDPNGHKLEIHATDLAARLEYARRHPWEGAEFHR